MKTLLFIGVLVAVISWSSALRCWQDCVLTEPGQKPDTDPPCEKKECPSIGKTMCARLITYIEKTTITALGCEQGEAGVCKEKKLGTIKGCSLSVSLTLSLSLSLSPSLSLTLRLHCIALKFAEDD